MLNTNDPTDIFNWKWEDIDLSREPKLKKRYDLMTDTTLEPLYSVKG